MLRITLAAALLLALAGGAASAQSVDDILARNVQARGGLDKLKAVQALRMNATVQLGSQGMAVPMVVYAKRPNFARKEMTMGGEKLVFAYDGSTAWQINPFDTGRQPAAIAEPSLDEFRRESDFDSPLIEPASRGYTITLAGTETADGRTLQHLVVVRNGTTQDCYLDASTGLEARTVIKTPAGVLEQQFSDYRDVQGLKFPFAVRTLQNGVPVADIKVDAIDVNPPVDDALFRKPS